MLEDPTTEIKGSVLSPAERAMSYEQRDQLVTVVREAVSRLAELADQIEAPNVCAYTYCHMAGAVSARSASRARNIARNCVPSGRGNVRLGAGRHRRRPELTSGWD